ncbi:MAG: kynureninase [Alphaproteobacteria bacterium]|nr:MAG: kynureninase [Alphaproteobacteria bacterium]
MTLNRADCEALDAKDPLAPARDRFILPEGLIYMVGNSLGALPKETAARMDRAVRQEWGQNLVTGWNRDNWVDLPYRVGAKIAKLVGAGADEVIATDSTSINIFKLVVGALALRPGRSKIITEPGNFPTDLYVLQGIRDLLPDRVTLEVVERTRLLDAVDKDTALVLLTQVHYKTGEVLDMARVTRAVQAKGALILWDLSHSTGAIPVDLNGANADLAVGCGYKFLNGGPGAPAFLYVAKRHQDQIAPPITAWFGHASPFEFSDHYQPAPGIVRNMTGTPAVLGLSALDASLDVWDQVDMATVRLKSLELGNIFIEQVEARCTAHGFRLASPRDDSRGSQVSFYHEHGYPVMQALIAHGVVGDFRAPDILRFAITPLYQRYVDIWDAAERIGEVMESGAWQRPEFARRAAVT